MIKSIRFWTAVLLLVFGAGYTALKKQNFVRSDSSTRQIKNISVQTEIPKSTYAEGIFPANTDNTEENTENLQSFHSYTTAVSDITTEKDLILSDTAEYEYYEYIEEQSENTPYISEQKITEIREKLDILEKCSEDSAGWIYIAGTNIDYPIVQGKDNKYYLNHAPDGSFNQAGSIFLDYNCKKDFSDKQNILFGHNMQYGMFGDIRYFRDREHFENHRYGWLFTREKLYRIDFYALVLASAYDLIYYVPADNAQWQDSVRKNGIYCTDTEFSEDDRFIALSSCTYDFENARLLLVGRFKEFQALK